MQLKQALLKICIKIPVLKPKKQPFLQDEHKYLIIFHFMDAKFTVILIIYLFIFIYLLNFATVHMQGCNTLHVQTYTRLKLKSIKRKDNNCTVRLGIHTGGEQNTY